MTMTDHQRVDDSSTPKGLLRDKQAQEQRRFSWGTTGQWTRALAPPPLLLSACLSMQVP